MCHTWVAKSGGYSTFFGVGMSGVERQNEGLKNWFFAKVRSKELTIFNILRAYELKFGPNLGCRTENSLNFWQISLTRVKIYYFCSKWGLKNWIMLQLGSKEKWSKGVKRGSWPPDIPIPPFQVSAPPTRGKISLMEYQWPLTQGLESLPPMVTWWYWHIRTRISWSCTCTCTHDPVPTVSCPWLYLYPWLCIHYLCPWYYVWCS